MGSQREKYETWLNTKFTGPRNPDDEAALLRAADAVDHIVASGRASAEELSEIAAVVSHPHTMRWSNGCDLLGQLAANHPEAERIIIALATDKKAHVRFAALCCLKRTTPIKTTVSALRLGLGDKSAKLRWKAAQTAQHFRLTQLLPEVAASLSLETNGKARESIGRSLALLRDGHIAKPARGGGIDLTVATMDGIASRFVSAIEFQKKGIAKLVAELRRDE